MVAGTSDAVLMVESEAEELSEEIMLGAVMFGHEQMQPVIDMIISMAEECAKEPWDFVSPDYSAEYEQVAGLAEADVRAAYGNKEKAVRYAALGEAKAKVMEAFAPADDDTEGKIDTKILGTVFKQLESNIVRNDILDTGSRIDGRDTTTVRPH